MNKLIFIVLIGVILAGWGAYWQHQRTPAVSLITPTEFARLAESEGAFVIDVHTPEQTHLPNTDAVIAYNEIAQNVDALPSDKSTPVLVYCRSGGMSAQAAQEISDLGYTQVYDLAGGANAFFAQFSQLGN